MCRWHGGGNRDGVFSIFLLLVYIAVPISAVAVLLSLLWFTAHLPPAKDAPGAMDIRAPMMPARPPANAEAEQ